MAEPPDDIERDEPYDRRGFNEWTELSGQGLGEAPFRLYMARYKSGSTQLRKLMRDPRSVLAEQIEGVTERSQVNALIVKYELTLIRWITWWLALVDKNGDVTLVLYKEQAPEKGG